MMKKYRLVWKMEFGNFKLAALHGAILSFILFFTLYFFGSVYGQQSELQQPKESVLISDTKTLH